MVTIILSDAEYELLVDTLSSTQDEGPFNGEGWQSDELEALRATIENAKPANVGEL